MMSSLAQEPEQQVGTEKERIHSTKSVSKTRRKINQTCTLYLHKETTKVLRVIRKKVTQPSKEQGSHHCLPGRELGLFSPYTHHTMWWGKKTRKAKPTLYPCTMWIQNNIINIPTSFVFTRAKRSRVWSVCSSVHNKFTSGFHKVGAHRHNRYRQETTLECKILDEVKKPRQHLGVFVLPLVPRARVRGRMLVLRASSRIVTSSRTARYMLHTMFLT